VYDQSANTYSEVKLKSDEEDAAENGGTVVGVEGLGALASSSSSSSSSSSLVSPVAKPQQNVFALWRSATVVVVHPNKSLDVQPTEGDLIQNVLSYCVMTELQAKEGAESFKKYIAKSRKQKPSSQFISAEVEVKELGKAARSKLDKHISKSIEDENISRVKQ
jgi:hypothetical protein